MVMRVKRKDAGTAKAAAVCRGSGSSPLGVMRILRTREFLVMMEVFFMALIIVEILYQVFQLSFLRQVMIFGDPHVQMI